MINISLEISNPCNEHCVHCYRHSLNSKKGFLTAEQAQSVLEQAKVLGAKSVTVTGGEALLNPDWREICKNTERLGFRLSLFTNGSLMTQSDADFIATLTNLKEIQFSLYSLDEESHDKITGLKGSCERTKNAVKMLHDRKIPIFISCPAMQENKKSFPDLMRKMDAENIGSCVDLMIFGESNYEGKNLSHQLTESDLEEFFPVAMENGGALSYIFGKSLPKNLSQIDFYDGATSSLLVSGDGEIYPMIGWYESLGNIKTDKLVDVFFSNPLLQKIRKIKATDIPECVSCEASDFCSFCPLPHLTANHGELGKVDNNFCDFVLLVKKFAQRRDKILTHKNTEVHKMLYRQKKDTYIRNYDGAGYITSTGIFNDRLVNESGTVFLCALSRLPQTLDQLADKILPQFVGVDRQTILRDAEEFYETLIQDGFIIKGETAAELDAQDTGFTYDAILPKTIQEDFTPKIQRADADTQALLEKHFSEKLRLTSFQIELTSKCNERCIHCYIPHKFKLYDIKPDLYYSTLEQLSKMGVLSVTLSGGEPMCNPHFLEYLRAAKKYDFYVNILSNLTLLTDEIVEAMKEGNVSSVQVSLYSLKPEIHDYITKLPGSCEKTKAAILKLIENNLPVQVSCPTMKANKSEYGEVMAWCHEHKIRAQTDYIIMAEYNHETDNLANRLSAEEAGEVIKQVALGNEDYQKEILKPDFVERCNALEQNPDRRLCGVGQSTCCMVANGNVYPCAGWQGMVLGNLNEHPLEWIWNNSEKIKWLRSLKFRDLGGGECAKCDKAAFCAPCMVRNANEDPNGDPLKINRHFCAVAAKNKQIVLEWRNAKLKAMGK